MCCSFLCGCLHDCKGVFNRLLAPLLIIDLALTAYIVAQLAVNSPFACCTYPLIEDCSYDDIGGADNVEVSFDNDYDAGFCVRIDNPTLDCGRNLTDCATDNNIDIYELCNESVLDDLAFNNWSWLLGILIVKMIGVTFLLVMDCKTTWCENKDAAEEDAEQTKKCCLCRCTKDCCKSLLIFMLRIFFLLFGTATTFVAIWLLKWTDRVSNSTCELVDNGIGSDCDTVQEMCADDENYYNIIWQDIELSGPYWANLAANILSGIIWAVRISVVWYYGRHIAKV